MKNSLKTTLLVGLAAGTWLPATVVCDVPDIDVVVRHDDDDWEGFFEDIIVIDRHDHDHCCDWFFFDWFD